MIHDSSPLGSAGILLHFALVILGLSGINWEGAGNTR